jgi:hypothetical protein
MGKMRDAIAITICILCLSGLLAHSMRPKPQESHVASEKAKKIMRGHGTLVLECRGTVCSFKRDGKVIKIRL